MFAGMTQFTAVYCTAADALSVVMNGAAAAIAAPAAK